MQSNKKVVEKKL